MMKLWFGSRSKEQSKDDTELVDSICLPAIIFQGASAYTSCDPWDDQIGSGSYCGHIYPDICLWWLSLMKVVTSFTWFVSSTIIDYGVMS